MVRDTVRKSSSARLSRSIERNSASETFRKELVPQWLSLGSRANLKATDAPG